MQFAFRGGAITKQARGLRRAAAAVAVVAVLVAGMVVIDREVGGENVSALPGATAQPAPTGPTGGAGGGSGPGFPLQPPDMPSGPPNGYNSGSYPAPDQGNGISIYNSDAPQSPASRGGYQQAPNYPQQLQPANGTQPPNYDAPLQPSAAHQPSAAPHTAAPRPSLAQQQPTGQPDTQQDAQRQQQCQSAAAQLTPAIAHGGGRGLLIVQLDNGRGSWKLQPAPTPNPSCPDCPPATQKQTPSDELTPDQKKAVDDETDKEMERKAQQCSVDGVKIAGGFVKELAGLGGAAFSGLSIPGSAGLATPLAWVGIGSGLTLAYDGFNDIKSGACGR